MLQRIKVFVRDSKAVAALEYALLVGILVVGIGLALATFTTGVDSAIDRAKAKVDGLITP